jgi:hypothetical protein
MHPNPVQAQREDWTKCPILSLPDFFASRKARVYWKLFAHDLFLNALSLLMHLFCFV